MDNNLNETVYTDYNDFQKSGITPLSMLDGDFDVIDIVNRYQSMFADKNVKLIESNNKAVLKGFKPYTEDNKYFSLFGFGNTKNTNQMAYPLVAPISQNISSSKNFPNYQALKTEVARAFKIKIKETNTSKHMWQHKKSKSILKGIKNMSMGAGKLVLTTVTLGRKKFKQNPVANLSKNKLVLKSSNNIYQIDKMAKIYNLLCENAVAKIYSKNKFASSNQSSIKLISSLIATQYSLLACNFGNVDTTLHMYASLSLQISNAFASMGTISKNDKNIIKTLTSQTVEAVLQKLDKSPSDIAKNLNSIGFELSSQENTLNNVLFGNFKSIQNEIEEEDYDNTECDVLPINEIYTIKSSSKLRRKTALNNIDNNICKVLAKTVDEYSAKYLAAVSQKKKSTLTREKNLVSKILNNYEVMSYDFSKSSQKAIIDELRNTTQKNDEYYAKIIALNILKKRDSFLDSYFDDLTLKADKELTIKTYANLYKEFVNKFITFDGKTFKTKFQSFLKENIKESIQKSDANNDLEHNR